MEDLRDMIKMIKGARITSISRSWKPLSTAYFDGLGNLEEYIYVMFLNNGLEIEFHYDEIVKWNRRQQLVNLSEDINKKLVSLVITDIIKDERIGGIFFLMNNGRVLFHNNDFGSELIYESYDRIFDENGELR